MYRTLILFLLLLVSSNVSANLDEAKKALSSGSYKKAIKLFTPLAEKGDIRAAVTIGNIYFNGKPGVKKNYEKAYDWYKKGFQRIDGDAWNNLGVMFRDGKGVAKNRQIAYLLFLFVNRMNLGSGETQVRAYRNLHREMEEQKPKELYHALCYSVHYLVNFVNTKGTFKGKLETSKKINRFKDAKFWTKAEKEKLNFKCEDK